MRWMHNIEIFNGLSYNKFTVLTRSDGLTNQPERRMSKIPWLKKRK